MYKLVELVRQVGDSWKDRHLIEKKESYEEDTRVCPKSAVYVTAYTALSEEPADFYVSSEEVSSLFEAAPKEADLYFDFDSQDIDQAAEDAVRVHEYLTTSIGLRDGDIRLYATGGKGFHLIVRWTACGLDPRPDLPQIYRRFARAIAGNYCKNRTLDTKIYNPRRLLRCTGSVHQTTGKRKLPVTIDDLKSGAYDGRDEPVAGWDSDEPCTLLKQSLLRIEEHEQEKLHDSNRLPKEFFHEPLDCIKFVMESGVPDGVRNDAAYTTALYWKGLGKNRKEVEDMLTGSALVRISGIDARELSKTVTSAFRSDKRFGLHGNVLEDWITDRDWDRWSKASMDESYESFNEVVHDFMHEMSIRKETLAKYYIPSLDARLGGINGGELVLIGGTTGTGKSEFAFHIAYNNAMHSIPAGFITLEVSNKDFIGRILRSKTGIDPSKFWSGQLTDEEKATLSEAAEEISQNRVPLFFRSKRSMMTVEELETLVESLIIEQHCRVIVIDHLHYIGSKERYQNDASHISHCIRSVNNLCVRYGVAMVVVAHFRKQPDPLHRPTLHEFRDSSAIEQEASTILLLWRNMTAQDDTQFVTELNLAKSRKDISLGVTKIRWDKNTRQYA